MKNITRERKTFLLGLALVLVAALVTRLYHIHSVPQGTYIDEMFTLRNTLTVMETHAPLFGQTPLIKEGWVETSNLYLTFNSLIIRLFGVSYLSIKLFSVIPGVAACVFFYLACRNVFSPGMAIVVALLLVFSEWHIRLSRYGWDASFLAMTFAAALWLLLASFRGRPRLAIWAGLAAGIGFYSYILGRLCLTATGGMLTYAAIRWRQRDDVQRLVFFCFTAAVTVAPLLLYYLTHEHATWVRVNQLSIFSRPAPVSLFLQNAWAHVLMFYTHGGIYARDNYPGMPALDILSGLLLLAGVVTVLVWRRDRVGLLLLFALAGTLLGGILSDSHEGAPYPYRTSSAVLPALLLAGIGLEKLLALARKRWTEARLMPITIPAAVAFVLLIAGINCYMYFDFEERNVSAMRLMGVEFRLIGEAIRQTTYPVYLAGPMVLRKLHAAAAPGEQYYDVNRTVPTESFGPDVSYLELLAFGNRYDWHLSMDENLKNGSVGKMLDRDVDLDFPRPYVAIFQHHDSTMMRHLISRYPADKVTTTKFEDSLHMLHFTMVTVEK